MSDDNNDDKFLLTDEEDEQLAYEREEIRKKTMVMGTSEGGDPPRPRISPSDRLAGFASENIPLLFKDQHDIAHAVIQIKDHYEIAQIESGRFKRYLSRLYYENEHQVIKSESITNVVHVIQAKAEYEGPIIPLALRVTWDSRGNILYDLTNEIWQYVRISRDGWNVVNNETPNPSPESYIRKLIYGDLNTLHERYVPEILYKWYRQPNYVEVWLEKTALLSTFRNFLKDRHVRIVPNRGYSSWAFGYENFKRLKHMSQEPYYEMINGELVRMYLEKQIHILYFGDYDPSGSDMDRFLKSGIADYFTKYFGLEGIVHFEPRIAATLDQIERYDLPPEPEESDTVTLDKLQRDPRYENFLEAHGGQLYAVELDALMAYVPDEFERIVKGAVDQYYYPEIWEKVLQEEEHSSEAIRRLAGGITREWLSDL